MKGLYDWNPHLYESNSLKNTEDDWVKDAYCRIKKINTTDFFPVRGEKTTVQEVCEQCKVQVDCLNYALDNHIASGIWGGKSGRQRRAILKERHEQSKKQRN